MRTPEPPLEPPDDRREEWVEKTRRYFYLKSDDEVTPELMEQFAAEEADMLEYQQECHSEILRDLRRGY